MSRTRNRSEILTVCLLGLLLFAVSPVRAEKDSGPLKLGLAVIPLKAASGEKAVKYIVTIENTGEKEVTVITAHLEHGLERNRQDGPTEVVFGYRMTMTQEGKLIVPSLSPLHPVTLRQNEVAVLDVESNETGLKSPLKRLPSIGQAVVRYEVSEAWGKRLGIWYGTITAGPYEIVGGVIVVPKQGH